ncbi:MAG: aminotransferase class IV [Deltaproteobacteria bacterium]|jgi:branched-chain amino acid aminotransferase|nr:aminotransferase class IV [Deltaproteobacteria bacterium]
MSTWPNYSPKDIPELSKSLRREWHKDYLVMFSSVWGGFSTHPELWGFPVDDHMAHRADGVFEAFKCQDGRVYCLNEHLERLGRSAASIGLELPKELDHVLDILKEAWRLGGKQDFQGRICVSRGPGSFSVNPYDAKGPEFYLVTLRLKKRPPESFSKGVTAISSPYLAKKDFAGVKSVDYLLNALVKKNAIEQGAEFGITFDSEGYLAEGPTENVAIVTKDGELLAPSWSRILKGVTLSRVLDRAQDLVASGLLRFAGNRDVHRDELWDLMAEAFLTATTYDVLPLTLWDGKEVGDGLPGPVTRELMGIIEEEAKGDNPYTTSLA